MDPKKIKSLIVDMDGVLWKSDTPIGNLPAIFELIHNQKIKVAFATNNGTRTPEQYIEKLAGYGVKAQSWQVITSSLAVSFLLNKRFPAGGAIFAVGEDGLMSALHDKGFETLSIDQAEKAQAVVMGIDREISFLKMSEFSLLLQNNIPFYATNSDKTFPTPRGEIPGAGAWVSVIVTSTGIEPIYAGKPAPYLFDLARERLGTTKEETLVIGDRLETDIAGGQNAGCPVALVLSGVSTREKGEAWIPKIDIIEEDLNSLVYSLLVK